MRYLKSAVLAAVAGSALMLGCRDRGVLSEAKAEAAVPGLRLAMPTTLPPAALAVASTMAAGAKQQIGCIISSQEGEQRRFEFTFGECGSGAEAHFGAVVGVDAEGNVTSAQLLDL
jgi:hypothetical protein